MSSSGQGTGRPKPPRAWQAFANPFGRLVAGLCPCGLRVLLRYHDDRPVAWRFQDPTLPIDPKPIRATEIEGAERTFTAVASCACGRNYRALDHSPWIEFVEGDDAE